MLQVPQLEIGDIVLQPLSRRLTVAGDVLTLTEQESYMLEALALCANTMVTRRMLVSVLQRQYCGIINPNSINPYIHRLRKKLAHSTTVAIDTVNRHGYKLCISQPNKNTTN